MEKREIKFRAWDNKKKEWLLGYERPALGGFSLFGEVMLFGEWSNVVNRFILNQSDRSPDDLIVTQYTGLKDKNGKEIYEGDILETETGIAKVVWNDAAFALESPGSEAIDWEHSSVYEKSKVIGNIYENPELLNH